MPPSARAAVAVTVTVAIAAVAGGAAPAASAQQPERRSLIYFAHLTDPQIADEASPARAELLHFAGGVLRTLWRPQEPFGPHVLDQAVRAVNRQTGSPLARARGPRARMALALVTGDLADNAQRNELRWAVRVLEGGRVDPFSGRRIGPGNPCPGASRADVRRLNRLVAQRRYTGVSRFRGFWDLDRWQRRDGMLERAQRPFEAQGLRVPWYSARGNHDAVPQGMYGPRGAHPRSLATGCRKVFPGRSRVARGWRGDPWSVLRASMERARLVPPDPERRHLGSPHEYRALHGRADRRHGFGLTSRAQLRASGGAATYYAFTPRPGLRFVALDTAADAGGPNGNLDHPQYLWLARELRRARARRQLVVVFGHHTLATMNNDAPDEDADRFDRDPRPSRPLHFGTVGPASVRELLLHHPNAILYVAGHVHRNRVTGSFRRPRSGFWQVSTSALADAPQQSRLLELTRNGDGTLSIFSALLDHAAPRRPPRGGTPARRLGPAQLASLSRALARRGRAVSPRRFGRRRTTELVLRDPFARR